MDWRVVVEYWARCSGRIVGAGIGFGIGYFLMRHGLLWTLIVGILTLAGYLLGRKLDERGETVGEFLDRLFPPGQGLSG